jgi:hypothetical protein
MTAHPKDLAALKFSPAFAAFTATADAFHAVERLSGPVIMAARLTPEDPARIAWSAAYSAMRAVYLLAFRAERAANVEAAAAAPVRLYVNEYGGSTVRCAAHAPVPVGGEPPIVYALDGVACPECERLAHAAAHPDRVRAALLSPALSHTRFKYGSVYIYHFDASSPTGVRMAEGIAAREYDTIAAELRGYVHPGALSPLSPTEAR